MWLFFHQVSLVAILANLFVVPLAGLIVVIGTLSVLAATASTTLTLLLNNANWLAVKVMLAGVLSMAHWPGASTYVADFSAWDSLHAPHVTIAQASTAQVMVLRYRGQNWLINPGSANDYRYLVDPLRKFYGINHWDGVILSEFSTSAIGGASNLAHETSVSHWWIPPGLPHSARLQALLQGLPTEIITRGFQHQLDADCRLSVVSPSPDDDYSRAADGELVLLLEYKGQRLLYAGSIGFGVEQHLVRSGQALPVHFLVQGYHPEEPSLSPMWLLALSPTYIIRAAPPRFQHGNFSEVLPEAGLAGHPLILDQAKTGAVEIKLEEGKSVVKPFLHS
jgi:beta-lactamase superfamily II metal-dependent hydrolase